MNNILKEALEELKNLEEDYLVEDIASVRKQYPNLNDDEFYNILKLDPTYKDGIDSVGTYGKWLLNLYNKNRSSSFDTIFPSNITDLLKEFDENKKYFPVEYRDINRIKSIKELEDILEANDIVLSDSQKNRKIRSKIKKTDVTKDAIYFGKFGDFDIYSPKTYEASCKLGQGTTWCTATNSDDYYFNDYTTDGPLYILINTKDKSKKYQIHFPSNSFTDENDLSLSSLDMLDLLKANPTIFSDFIDKYIGENEKNTDLYGTLKIIHNNIKNNKTDSFEFLLAYSLIVSPKDIKKIKDNIFDTPKGVYMILSEEEANKKALKKFIKKLREHHLYYIEAQLLNTGIKQAVNTEKLKKDLPILLKDFIDTNNPGHVGYILSTNNIDVLSDEDKEELYDAIENASTNDIWSLKWNIMGRMIKDKEDEYIKEIVNRYGSDPLRIFDREWDYLMKKDYLDINEIWNKMVEEDPNFRGSFIAYDDTEIKLGTIKDKKYFAYRVK